MDNLYLRQQEFNLKTDIVPVIIGVGGVGFHVAKMLVMAGVKDIVLFDDDIIEEHNLNRLDLPLSSIGMNKTEAIKMLIEQMRPDCKVVSYGYKFNPEVLDTLTLDITHIVDCTDVHSVQLSNQAFARNKEYKYMKVGYNGPNVSINEVVGEWDTGDTPDGYTIIPSYVVPATVIGALAAHKILTESTNQIATTIDDMYNFED